MSYQKTIWVKDDIVTAEKLNKIEDQLESNEDRTDSIEEHLSTNAEYSDQLEALQEDVIQLESGKQDKLVAGDNITIDENTNVISASGGFNGSGTIDGGNFVGFEPPQGIIEGGNFI